MGWIEGPAGLVEIGADPLAFAFDNEEPRHKIWLEPYRLADRLVTCGHWLEFIEDGGYRNPALWLSEGWATVQQYGWQAPLYWREGDDGWMIYTLAGERPVDPDEPVCHVSGYEAGAYAEWAGLRLPCEHELELLAGRSEHKGALLFDGSGVHPRALNGVESAQSVIGGVWEWSASAYEAFPGYEAPSGAVGEYNGKFMSNQRVLRGGSAATPGDHIRTTYRNFFPPEARWQFSGIRLAKKLSAPS